MAGDGRAIGVLKKLYGDPPRCEKDKILAARLGEIGLMQRNPVTGIVEVSIAEPWTQRAIAAIYPDPCPCRIARPQTTEQLEAGRAPAVASSWPCQDSDRGAAKENRRERFEPLREDLFALPLPYRTQIVRRAAQPRALLLTARRPDPAVPYGAANRR